MIKVSDLVEKLGFKIVTDTGDLDREVVTCYIGDLLSWVMGRAPEDCAWLTIMGNINSIAVASLADVSCIILTENAALDEDAKNKALQNEITILATEENSYVTGTKIYELLKN